MCNVASKSLFSAAALLSLLGCAQTLPDPVSGSQFIKPASPAQYSWMLPKTVITATAVFTLNDCDDGKPEPALDLSYSVTLSSSSEPDKDLGPDFSDGLLTIDPEELKSFWQDRNISVKVNPNTHILASLGSQPTNQVGAIIGSVATSAAKFAAVGLGVPAVAGFLPDNPESCGPAVSAIAKVRELKARLASAAVTPDDIKNIPAQIQALQNTLTITVQQRIDPGVKPIHVYRDQLSLIAQLRPGRKQLEESTWFKDKKTADQVFNNRKLVVDIYFDIGNAYPHKTLLEAVACTEDKRHCELKRSYVPRGALFREVAYIPVVAKHGNETLLAKSFPFGQFGTPSVLPLSAGLFEQLTWNLSFADSGELTDAQFSSKATGLGFASLLSNAASVTNSIATEQRNAANALDSSTIRLQNENAALKAQIDNINYTQQLHTLLASGAH